MSKPTPEQRADTLVVVDSAMPGGPLFVQLTGLPEGVILFGPYENPDLGAERRSQSAAIPLKRHP